MIGINDLIEQLVDDLVDIYPINSLKKKPKYPFLTYNIITLNQDDGYFGHLGYITKDGDVYERLVNEPFVILSINAYSNNIYDAIQTIQEAYEYFKFTGYDNFYKNNFNVVSISDIQNRTINIVNHYEYRYGFDVKIRKVNIIKRRINNIEEYKLNLEVDK